MDQKTGKKITNKKQFAAMVEFMENNVAIARGATQFADKEVFKRKMVQMEKILNSLGPPVRTFKEWEKVWRDYKLKLKHKMAQNKKELKSTGGGLCKLAQFSDLEECVISIMNYKQMGNTDTTGFGLESEKHPRKKIRTASPIIPFGESVLELSKLKLS